MKNSSSSTYCQQVNPPHRLVTMPIPRRGYCPSSNATLSHSLSAPTSLLFYSRKMHLYTRTQIQQMCTYCRCHLCDSNGLPTLAALVERPRESPPRFGIRNADLEAGFSVRVGCQSRSFATPLLPRRNSRVD